MAFFTTLLGICAALLWFALFAAPIFVWIETDSPIAAIAIFVVWIFYTAGVITYIGIDNNPLCLQGHQEYVKVWTGKYYSTEKRWACEQWEAK